MENKQEKILRMLGNSNPACMIGKEEIISNILGTDTTNDKNVAKPELDREMIERKSCDEFRETGLLFFINQFLHVFGWAIVVEYKEDGSTIMYPVRTKFRGFDEKTIAESYNKISKYMVDNASQLSEECDEKLK